MNHSSGPSRSCPSFKTPLHNSSCQRSQIHFHFTKVTSTVPRVSKQYLLSDLNISKMYALYKEIQSNPVSFSLYSQYFHKKTFVLRNQKKTTTTSKLIKIQATSGEDKSKVIAKRDFHHFLDEKAYATKRTDKEIAKVNPLEKVFAFDLQQC